MEKSCQEKCMCLSESLRGACLANCVVDRNSKKSSEKPQYKISACNQTACK